jgi:putative hemolysin
MSLTPFIILGILLILSGIFSGSETAIFSLSDARVLSLKKKKIRGALTLHKLKKQPNKLLITILIGNNVVNISASAIATYLATDTFGSLGIGIATGLLTLFILIFGEIIPKSFAYTKPEKISLIMAFPIYTLSVVLSPLVIFFEFITTGTIKLLGRKPDKRITSSEIKSMIKMGAEAGVLKKDEEEMIEGVFELKDTPVKKIMTPRSKVVAVEKSTMIGDVLSKAIRTGYSRFPVYNKTIDRVVGIVHTKDMLPYTRKQWLSEPISEAMQKAIFVYEDKDVRSLLTDLRKRNKHIAIVLNRKKNLSGIVTIEDVLEEVVGEIYDETDARKGRR